MKSRALAFEVDKLTNSIENVISGESFDTEVIQISWNDRKLIKKTEWAFDWHKELKTPTNFVYKLTTLENPKIIHGLIALTDKGDHIFMDLIENAIFNKGKAKLYQGVAGNLIAFACKCAFEAGYDGVVAFTAKTSLIDHYEKSLGAKRFSGNNMFIDTKESLMLVKRYFKNFQL